jgi:hypothetical protein
VKLVGSKSIISITVFLAALLIASCSSGGDSNGFCRRWSNAINKVNSTEELLSAIRKENLGDPGGTLSDLRDSLEFEIRYGTTDAAVLYTEQIFAYCAELE